MSSNLRSVFLMKVSPGSSGLSSFVEAKWVRLQMAKLEGGGVAVDKFSLKCTPRLTQSRK
jgi:hypothetical protein